MSDEPVIFYVIYEDGTLEVLTVVGDPDAEPVLNKPGRIASKIEYDQYLRILEEQHAIYLAEIAAREQQLLKADYDALIAAGIPEATARRITGYTGP